MVRNLTKRLEMNRLLQAESKNSFRWHPDFTAFGQYLCASTGGGASNCADSSALSATGDRAEQRTQDSATTYVFGGAFVLADALLTRPDHIAGAHRIALASDIHRIQIQC